ncbi:MAG: extracellular solute-binding protein [Tenericutes bacterium]|nr:extracellular solute-binding protein [Mycoplasmatota bacterium]
MKKLIVLFGVVLVALTVAACQPKDDTLVIFQNKIEIDQVLRDYAEAWGEANGVDVEVKSCGGDTCAYGTQILAEFQADKQPDIFVIEGLGGYNIYEDKLYEFEDEEWMDDTDLAFTVDGKVYGFPVAVEGWGMGYNKDLLLEIGFTETEIMDLESVSQTEMRAAFQKVQDAYDADVAYDDYTVVSMAAGPGMTWVTGLHNFNGYLSAGLAYDDNSVITSLLAGQVNTARLNDLANWVEMLFEFANQSVLTTGGYDEQVGAFAEGKAAFIHQGNWTDGSYGDSDFEMGYLPHATMATGNNKIFIGAPSYYVINKDSTNIEAARLFLEDLAGTQAGHEYMVNEANMVPAFNSVTLTPATPLSAAVMEWNQAGKAYAWWQNDMPSGFGMETLGPIYTLYAAGTINKTEFIAQMTAAIEDLG